MNWIRPEKRLAIYLRDGLACCYCGASVEESERMTLDHLRPHSKGGSNCPTNLITCCLRCNSSRGARAWRVFAARVADYLNHGVTAEQIISHITATRRRKLDIATAKELIARRGSWTAAMSA